MAAGSQGFERRSASTQFLRVPARDWTAVKGGFKTEWRMRYGGEAAGNVQFLRILLPTPVVAYMTRGDQHENKMMVLDECWVEPLGAISEESLRREGFASVAHFRRYWTDRTKLAYRPLERVQVFRVHEYTDAEREVLGGILLDRLFGEFTGASTEPEVLSRRSPLSTRVR